MKIAVQGCCHGELDKIYATLEHIQQSQGIRIDLLLICGDFQALRNNADLRSLACPEKFRRLGIFHEYYSGVKKAPILTLFIGGNHEASNYLWELYHGGWVCPNIYFLGYANVVRFNGLRIGGISGIYKREHYELGFYEKYPYNDSSLRSIYHVRKHNVDRLLQLKTPVHVFLSHDWPLGIVHHGNTRALLARKRHFQEEVENNSLGSPPLTTILERLKPAYWFAAHLHVKFAAFYVHSSNNIAAIDSKTDAIVQVDNPEAIDIDLDDDESEDETFNSEQIPTQRVDANVVLDPGDQLNNMTQPQDPPQSSSEEIAINNEEFPSATRFLSLDKCLPGKHFLQVIDIPFEGDGSGLRYDPEWLSIVKATAPFMRLERNQKHLPLQPELDELIQKERSIIDEKIALSNDFLNIPENFVMTAPSYDPSNQASFDPNLFYRNPQTELFCELIDIDSVININGQPPFHSGA